MICKWLGYFCAAGLALWGTVACSDEAERPPPAPFADNTESALPNRPAPVATVSATGQDDGSGGSSGGGASGGSSGAGAAAGSGGFAGAAGASGGSGMAAGGTFGSDADAGVDASGS